ncbi:MAG: LD-carboxypeptidase [Saprospiraceae bacterium]
MERRKFFLNTGLAAVAVSLQLPTGMAQSPEHRHKPARLHLGATVGLIAPGSPIPEARYVQALENMGTLGFKVKEGRNTRASRGYLAGTDEQRLADLHAAFADPEVNAVWCLRGGYGCLRLLPQLDYDLIRRNPKPFIGYSDITALHLAIHGRTGLVCFHGPVAVSEFPDDTVRHLRSVLLEPTPDYTIAVPAAEEILPGEEFRPFVINPGQAQGTLTGGNLSLLAAMAGTPYLPTFKHKIVFIEDIGEQPYRIDRMLYQLAQATDLAQAAGIALGVFTDCNPKGDSPSLSLVETLTEFFARWKMPVTYGLPFGHIAHQATLPYGVQVELDATKGTLRLLETAVE